ncbi:MAG: hypothetical protein ACXVH3_32465 [Solirubrobacteraceae bacterium]
MASSKSAALRGSVDNNASSMCSVWIRESPKFLASTSERSSTLLPSALNGNAPSLGRSPRG